MKSLFKFHLVIKYFKIDLILITVDCRYVDTCRFRDSEIESKNQRKKNEIKSREISKKFKSDNNLF